MTLARSLERDACGIGFVANVEGRASRDIVETAIRSLCRVRHRGAVAADALSGDGAGMLFPLPRPFLAREAHSLGIPGVDIPRLGVAMVFDFDHTNPSEIRRIVGTACRSEAIDLLGWRDVPVYPQALGPAARRMMPRILQGFIQHHDDVSREEADQRAFRARKRAERTIASEGRSFYFPSFGFTTVVYKALVAADQLAEFYPDLSDPLIQAPFVVFHQRYSTNTAPTWERAQPFRMLCHNGEINTIAGNANRMRSREGRLGKWSLLDEAVLRPIIDESTSDSGMLDNAVELLVREGEQGTGRDIRHAMAMTVPAAWEGDPRVDQNVRDFYRWHTSIMEPWDGPAALVFTDGVRVGACLDRNGLRPLRYAICDDGMVACASEAGAVYTRGRGRVRRGKLGPGQMLSVDPAEGGVSLDPISPIAARKPYGAWLAEHRLEQSTGEPVVLIPDDILRWQVAHGYTREELTLVLRPAAVNGKEATFSMGDDTPLPPFSRHPRPLYHYFKQRFAQVTNPPIDHLRERFVMSLMTLLGPRDPLLWERPESAALLEYESFFLFKSPGGVFLDATWPVEQGPDGMRGALEALAAAAVQAASRGSGILVVSDQHADAARAPIPSLAAVGAANTALLRAGHRTRTSIVVHTDDARESHHFACLLGYGAEAIYPRLALATVSALAAGGRTRQSTVTEALLRYRSAIEEGVLKVLSKMGISSVDSYRGAQIFDALGLDQDVIDLCFEGTASPVGGIGFADIARDVLSRHREAYGPAAPKIASPGLIKHQKGGEFHANNPTAIRALHETVDPGLTRLRSTAAGDLERTDQRAAHLLHQSIKGSPDFERYLRFAALVDGRPPTQIRDVLEFAPTAPAVPIDQVEPAREIVKRFSTGAVSHGAIGAEAHETLAVAFNRLGAKSNTGEGGEDPARYRGEKNCRIKQVASGRFGVTAEYCSFADELQIKIAQGSKPGEGGQLPGHKVTDEIARLRHTRPGVALISPPPHHDIYSIEDLSQLIFDLKQVNPSAEVSVKLVSEVGVGTIAAGVVKGLAEVVHIAGADGGTGASPLSSIKNAGLPWEIGLAETQRALVENGLRARARVRVDGGLKTGRDVVMAALLGADEYSFGTAALLAEGCIMVRTCHLDTCPVGIATQRPELRAKFAGTPDMVANYILHVAEEVRHILASLGLRSLDEAIGRADLVRRRSGGGPADTIDLSPLLSSTDGERRFRRTVTLQNQRSDLGDRIYDDAWPTVREGGTVKLSYEIHNHDRTVGARLGGAVGHRFGATRPPGTAVVRFTGEAGQSFGAFLTEGAEFRLTGEANDYVGKAMSGGRIVIVPPPNDAGDPWLVGNTVLYGATGGELFVAGRAGERFAVRNSGATAVIEGAGEHCCEYMTDGTVVALGPVGLNLGAGMTGGQAYVHDPDSRLPALVNPDLVDAHRPSDEHLGRLRILVERHLELTGSARARAILIDWEQERHRFWRIAPKGDVDRITQRHEGTLQGAEVSARD